MKSFKGRPNIVTPFAHIVLDMGRTKEALLLMEYCEKSFADVWENRGAGYFEEKLVLLRCVQCRLCNAVLVPHQLLTI